jgi:squalene-hopene/tetraprenyl-beta-curcumene cyclase
MNGITGSLIRAAGRTSNERERRRHLGSFSFVFVLRNSKTAFSVSPAGFRGFVLANRYSKSSIEKWSQMASFRSGVSRVRESFRYSVEKEHRTLRAAKPAARRLRFAQIGTQGRTVQNTNNRNCRCQRENRSALEIIRITQSRNFSGIILGTETGFSAICETRMSATSHLRLLQHSVWLCAATFLATTFQASAAADNSQTPDIRRTIARSVPFIERGEGDWIASKGCVSCHHTAFTVWSLGAAKRKGIAVDEAELDGWRNRIADWPNLLDPSVRANAKREVIVPAHPDTVSQVLLAREPRHAESGAPPPPWVMEYANGLLAGQQTDGSWTPGGQLPLQKRPKRETQEVTTMWVMLVVAADDSNLPNASKAAALQKARSWLGDQTVGKSTEWWATRAMLERKVGGTAATADRFRAELLKRQHADGGWGWLCDDESDALGTGIALYALAQTQLPNTNPAIVNARQFLTRTQAADGAWPVHGTKENKKNRVEATATFWGTCWAVIGLCETLGDASG